MWLLIKFSVSILIFFIRYTNQRLHLKLKGDSPAFVHEGIELYTHVVTQKNGGVRSSSWNRNFKCRTFFKLTRESRFDRFFKNWGLAEEIQTQDLAFDDLIYIASDSTSFMRKIQGDRDARRLITELFANGCRFILCDGKTLSVNYEGNRTSDFEGARIFAELTRLLEDLQKLPNDFDPFVFKALITESLIWGLAGYTLMSFTQWNVLHEDVYLNPQNLAKVALLCSGILSVTLILLILALFKGSSRGHRIIIESILVLALCLPVGGIALFSDINIHLDRSFVQPVDATVASHYTQMHRGRRGSRYYTYHIQLSSPSESSYVVPFELKISPDLYDRLQQGQRIRIEVGKGKLHQPWIKNIEPI